MAAARKLAVLVDELEPGLAAVAEGIFPQGAVSHELAVFVDIDPHGHGLALVADVFAHQHLRLGKALPGGVEPDVLFLQGLAHDHVVHDPAQIVGVLAALVAQGGEAVVLTQEEAAVGGHAVEPAGVLADDVAFPQTLVETIAVEGLFAQGEGAAHHHVGGLGGDDLNAVQHAVVGQALVIAGHIVGGGFHAGAGTEGGQDAPPVVADEAAVLIPLPERGDVAAGQSPGLGAIQIENGAGHAHGPKDPLLEELLQGIARRLVHHIGEDGIALVGIAHIQAGLAQGGVAALGDVIDHLVDLVHLVGGGGLHGAGPVGFPPLVAVEGDGPLQGLHGRDARRVGGQVMEGDRLLGRALEAEIGEIFGHGVVKGAFPLAGQDAQGQGGGGFAHGRDAHDGVFINGPALVVGHAIAFFKDDALRPADGNGDAGELFFLDAGGKGRVQGLEIIFHWCRTPLSGQNL